MTPDEAIAIVKQKAAGRTRFEGSLIWLDEVLVEEIERLRNENVNLDHACKIADRKVDALSDLLTAARDAHEFLSGASFEGWSEATEADIHREKLEQAIAQATEAMK